MFCFFDIVLCYCFYSYVVLQWVTHCALTFPGVYPIFQQHPSASLEDCPTSLLSVETNTLHDHNNILPHINTFYDCCVLFCGMHDSHWHSYPLSFFVSLTSSIAGLPAAIKILPRSAHCCMVLLRPSILAFSSWCCFIIPSRAVKSLR